MKNFTWENFDNEFLKAVIYSPETNADDRPLHETDEKDDLVCSMNLICTAPNDKFVKSYRQIIEDKLLCKCPDILDEVFNVPCAFQERISAKNSRAPATDMRQNAS